jgi:hypothetical protein
MTPSEQCKAAGLKSLAEFARLTGESKENLINWHRDRPRRFELMLAGVISEIKKQTQPSQ